MKKIKLVAIAALAVVLVGCASTPKVAESKVDVEENVVQRTVIDWDGRTLGEVSAPQWLKNINRGNANVFKEQFNVQQNRICRLASSDARSKEEAKALCRLDLSASLAQELKEKLITRAGKDLSDGQVTVLRSVAAETKVEISGIREEATFWQKARIKDKEKGTVTDSYIFYTVYSMSEETWDALLKKYLIDIMGDANLETSSQKRIGALYSEMKADADKKDAAKQAEEERLYNIQMERIKALQQNTSSNQNSNTEKTTFEKAKELEQYLQ